MFSKAITRKPCESLTQGITTANLGTPDYVLACEQYRAYVAALRKIGLQVDELPAENDYPDSVFVEDTALLSGDMAVLTRPGALSRRGETESMAVALAGHFDTIHRIEAPATLDAGDVMMVGDHFYIGLSERTNQAGADQLAQGLAAHGKTASSVEMRDMLHLKTGVSYLESGLLLACGEFIGHPMFSEFKVIEVAPHEAYAANSVWINGSVLVPAGNPQTEAAIQAEGLPTIALEMSEFRKLDGGLSCLSLRF